MSPVGAALDDGGFKRVPQGDQLSGGATTAHPAAGAGRWRWCCWCYSPPRSTVPSGGRAGASSTRCWPSLGGLVQYSNALLARTDLSPQQRAAVLSTFAVDAERFPPRTTEARQALERVRPLPWDGELREARAALLARSTPGPASSQAP